MKGPGIRVIQAIDNVEFCFFGEREPTFHGEGASETISFHVTPPVHGTILYIAGMVEGDEDALICVGQEDGADKFRPAIYPPFLDFEIGWFRLLGRYEDANQIIRTRENAEKMKG